MSSVLLKNIQTIVSGDIENPVTPGDAIWVVDGLDQKVRLFVEHENRGRSAMSSTAAA